jgi:hypothetical protein
MHHDDVPRLSAKGPPVTGSQRWLIVVPTARNGLVELDLMAIVFTRRVSVSYGHISNAHYRAGVTAAILALGSAGFAVGHFFAPPDPLDPELVRLLRLMALIKLGLVAGATWLIVWRLSWPCSPHFAAKYLIALALMTITPGLIWYVSHLLVAFGLFHSGIVLGVTLALRDTGPPRSTSFSGSRVTHRVVSR